jgi:hypothetical protein
MNKVTTKLNKNSVWTKIEFANGHFCKVTMNMSGVSLQNTVGFKLTQEYSKIVEFVKKTNYNMFEVNSHNSPTDFIKEIERQFKTL